MDENESPELEPFDLIICRNVLIYFRDWTIEKVIDRLWQKLTPEGLLLVGASESPASFQGGVRVRRATRGVLLPKAAEMSGIRVLIVDDSAFARKVVRESLETSPQIEVVGIARDGIDALEKIAELRAGTWSRSTWSCQT